MKGVRWCRYIVAGRDDVYSVWRDLATWRNKELEQHRPVIVSRRFWRDLSRFSVTMVKDERKGRVWES